jgi:hypothetical protein
MKRRAFITLRVKMRLWSGERLPFDAMFRT